MWLRFTLCLQGTGNTPSVSGNWAEWEVLTDGTVTVMLTQCRWLCHSLTSIKNQLYTFLQLNASENGIMSNSVIKPYTSPQKFTAQVIFTASFLHFPNLDHHRFSALPSQGAITNVNKASFSRKLHHNSSFSPSTQHPGKKRELQTAIYSVISQFFDTVLSICSLMCTLVLKILLNTLVLKLNFNGLCSISKAFCITKWGRIL